MGIGSFIKGKIAASVKRSQERNAFHRILSQQAQAQQRQAYAKAYIAEAKKKAATDARARFAPRPSFFSGFLGGNRQAPQRPQIPKPAASKVLSSKKSLSLQKPQPQRKPMRYSDFAQEDRDILKI